MSTKSFYIMLLLTVHLDHGVSRSVEFVFAFEGSKLRDEDKLKKVAALLSDEVARRCRRPAYNI